MSERQPEDLADEHEHRRQDQGDLERAVEDDRERVLGLVAGGELDADDVLDSVARDGDDDQPGEGLGDA